MTENDERYVHRIEAFSDIVIGFSLAQLGATLVVPAHAAAIAQNDDWLFGFFFTFSLVCLMWWSHNRIFRTVFVPTTAALLLNFLLLATIVLLVYFAQFFAHITTVPDDMVAWRAYFLTLALNYLLTAALTVVGIRATASWENRTVEMRAYRLAVVYAVSGSLVMLCTLVSFALGDNQTMLSFGGISVPLGFALGVALARRRYPPLNTTKEPAA
jgi:uncharacterized membrane protein